MKDAIKEAKKAVEKAERGLEKAQGAVKKEQGVILEHLAEINKHWAAIRALNADKDEITALLQWNVILNQARDTLAKVESTKAS